MRVGVSCESYIKGYYDENLSGKVFVRFYFFIDVGMVLLLFYYFVYYICIQVLLYVLLYIKLFILLFIQW